MSLHDGSFALTQGKFRSDAKMMGHASTTKNNRTRSKQSRKRPRYFPPQSLLSEELDAEQTVTATINVNANQHARALGLIQSRPDTNVMLVNEQDLSNSFAPSDYNRQPNAPHGRKSVNLMAATQGKRLRTAQKINSSAAIMATRFNDANSFKDLSRAQKMRI